MNGASATPLSNDDVHVLSTINISCPDMTLLTTAIGYFSEAHSNPFKGEVHYKALYDSFCQRPDDWETFLHLPEIYVLSEQCVGVFGVYTTCLRQRGDYVMCKEGMVWYTRCLNIYRVHAHARMTTLAKSKNAAQEVDKSRLI